MKKILFITVGTEVTASSRARIYKYRPFLKEADFDARIIPYNNSLDARLNALNKKRGAAIWVFNKINHFFKCLYYLTIAPRYDVIFIQRVLLPKNIFKLVKKLSKRIIFDFDDAIYLADKWSKNLFGKDKFLSRFRYTVKNADFVIVSNKFLKEAALKLNPNVLELPTPVDTKRLIPKANTNSNGRVVIGWIGSPWATRYIVPLQETFKSLIKKYPFVKVELVGAAPLEGWGADVTIKDWSLKDELRDLQDFDIGIMPLADDDWCRGKGGYKLLQYMAIGIPCLASPIGLNKEIIKDGVNGFLIRNREEWDDRLSQLIRDRDLRIRMGREGRKMAEDTYSYEKNLTKLLNILKG